MTNQPLSGRQGKALAACYFYYFAILGLLIPYLGVYFSELGFDSLEIGQLMSILFATRMLAPNLWAYLADRYGQRVRFIQGGSLLAALIFAISLSNNTFTTLAWVLFGYTFFWNGILPQLEVVTLASLGKNSHHYGRIRSFGSAGFIALVLMAGAWFERHGSASLPWIGLGLFALLTLASLWLREPTPAARPSDQHGSFLATLFTPSMVLFLLASTLLQASYGPYYTFFVLYMADVGVGETLAGVMVALGVLAEIGLFALAPRLLARFALADLLLAVALVTALRWGLTWQMQGSEIGQLCVQALHGISFGLGHACAIQYIHRSFASHDQGKAQAIYASIAFGLGGAAGAWLAGVSWHNGSGAAVTWAGAAVAALVAMVILLWFKQQQRLASALATSS
ncbi:MFS transporter [uncultured Ferrimonas sp.]|uniref:MFS transporter n=1 Tax=uncultured Ferrimonas sp. TaxID=432640 RepID=UPI00262648AF|nr:MFS transporter [uncultured Ferrimonas sp.]